MIARPILHFVTLTVLAGSLAAGPVRFLPWDDATAARKIAFEAGSSQVELEDLHPQKRSEPVSFKPGETAPRLVALDRKSDDGTPVSIEIKGLGKLRVPLVIILPDPGHPGGLRPFVIEDSSDGFAWGDIRFVNATGRPLLIRSENKIHKIADSWKPIDVSPGGTTRNIGVQAASPDDLESILYSAVWEHDPETRKLVFLLPGADARTGAIDVKIIPENRRVAAAAEAARRDPGSQP